ncbi:hypothetical protein [Shewanella youngdeokensis]|uniref:Uncharacterized protein n=1 Tax=Shewanella youngdeokensis TaxID=2999068 RepID=A0ABZ0JX31_9GAMM|nr:hypothetical protein RGE70_13395 [Shewanella sp. DAU334]
MLSRPFYEALPYSYIAIGTCCLLLLEQTLVQILAVVVYILGSRVYALRSANRRTDPKKRRKRGRIPSYLYEHIPSLCLLGSILLTKLDLKAAPIFALICCSYGIYLFVLRASYRKHQIVASEFR